MWLCDAAGDHQQGPLLEKLTAICASSPVGSPRSPALTFADVHNDSATDTLWEAKPCCHVGSMILIPPSPTSQHPAARHRAAARPPSPQRHRGHQAVVLAGANCRTAKPTALCTGPAGHKLKTPCFLALASLLGGFLLLGVRPPPTRSTPCHALRATHGLPRRNAVESAQFGQVMPGLPFWYALRTRILVRRDPFRFLPRPRARRTLYRLSPLKTWPSLRGTPSP